MDTPGNLLIKLESSMIILFMLSDASDNLQNRGGVVAKQDLSLLEKFCFFTKKEIICRFYHFKFYPLSLSTDYAVVKAT